MNLGIVGYGCVGKAVANGFERRGHSVYVNDVAKIVRRCTSKEFIMERCEAVFVCVPTPDASTNQVEIALKELNAYQHQGGRKHPLVAIKSTVPPGTTDTFAKQFPKLRLACNPEFLREWNADKDFLEPDRIVTGVSENEDHELFRELYRKWRCPIYRLLPYEAELVKYLSNAYLVLKVALSQEFKDVAGREVWEAVGADRRIGFSHLDPTKGKVPRNTPCLAKDTLGLQRWLREKKLTTPILDAAVKGGIES